MPRGRLSIFGSKADGVQVHGVISKVGSQRFERERKKLAAIYLDVIGKKPAVISDADTVEFLARGVAETRSCLHDLKKGQTHASTD